MEMFKKFVLAWLRSWVCRLVLGRQAAEKVLSYGIDAIILPLRSLCKNGVRPDWL
jgi:hypothetical protein